MPDTNAANNTIISLENFLDKMSERYKQDFIAKVKEYSYGGINQTGADEYFRTFVTALYNNRIEGIGTYGKYFEGDERNKSRDRRKGRQDLVNAFLQEVSNFIQEFSSLAARGSTLLWSNYAIGRFAADDSDIIKSAGVTDENAQTLNQTQLGKLLDNLKITGLLDEEDTAIGYIWDNQYNVWASMSKEFASKAEGEVHVFVPKNIAAYTVFWNVELPELRKRMQPLENDPKVDKITIHHPTDEALKEIKEIDNKKLLSEEKLKAATNDDEKERLKEEIKQWDKEKKKVMLKTDDNGRPISWQNLDFSEATLEVPDFSNKQKGLFNERELFKRLFQDSNPLLLAKMDNYVRNNKTRGAITISKLTEIARGWRDKTSGNVELYRKIADKYGHIISVPFETTQKIAKGQATDSEIKQYGDKLVKAFQNDLRTRETQSYNDSDIEIVTRLLHQNYTRLQNASSVEMSTKVISKTEIANLVKTEPGAMTVGGFSHFNEYSRNLSAKDAIEQFGLNYQYQDSSGETVKPYLMSVDGRDRTLPFVYYFTTPVTNEIKKQARIPLDPTVKARLEAIANDPNRSNDDELKKMAKELTTPGVYHELTPNTDKNQPRYGTQSDGNQSYAGMLRTTYSTADSQLSPGTMIRAKGPNGEDFKIADWDGLTWTVSPQSTNDLPDWLKGQGRPEDRLNVETELKQWKFLSDDRITPPTNIPGPVRAFMEHHFQTGLDDITIQKVGILDNDASTSTLIKFKPGEYNDTTQEGLRKIANKLGEALKLQYPNSDSQVSISEAVTKINNELPQNSASIKNDLIKLRRPPQVSFADLIAARKTPSRYITGRTPSMSGTRRPSSRR
ncbi:MAG: hypothetical protein F6K18_22395 [Okeania sp. SIO2C2]|uniref:hypothetical protein n=1 Tax=Okeania sp. SIO2C2 TaxID=2607787 RepID=UPI0013BAD2EE|nr:hypothetical protein [Okeania sp. SIO2C2]NEP89361.1 hypothetical protein [Okeania sp. SIO2C2]